MLAGKQMLDNADVLNERIAEKKTLLPMARVQWNGRLSLVLLYTNVYSSVVAVKSWFRVSQK